MRMKKIKRRKTIILSYIMYLCLVIFSCSFSFMPLASKLAIEIDSRIPLIITGSMFWGGFIIGYILFFNINIRRKNDSIKELTVKRAPGVVCFCTSKAAAVIDILMLLCIVVLIYCIVRANEATVYLLLSLSMLLIQLHSYMNGKNYQYIQYIRKGENK